MILDSRIVVYNETNVRRKMETRLEEPSKLELAWIDVGGNGSFIASHSCFGLFQDPPGIGIRDHVD